MDWVPVEVGRQGVVRDDWGPEKQERCGFH